MLVLAVPGSTKGPAADLPDSGSSLGGKMAILLNDGGERGV